MFHERLSSSACIAALALPLAALPQDSVERGTAPGSWDTPRAIAPLVSSEGLRYAGGELLVCARGSEDVPALIEAARAIGAELAGEIPRWSLLKLELPTGSSAEAAVELFAGRDDVRFAELNYLGRGGALARGGAAPNDTSYGAQWHHEQPNDADLDSEDAWAVETGSADVVLAVLDTGIDFLHPEFLGRTLPGYDFVHEDGDPTADAGHGPLVTALAAANADNAFQGAGVDRACTILPVKVLNQNGLGTTFDLVQGLEYCAEQRADVVSMSLINYPLGSTLSLGLAAARDADCILMACAGNGGIGNADTSGPGASAHTISVGATTQNDERAGYSGTGQALDFVAPGNILVTGGLSLSDETVYFSGCSAATPLAAGIVSLLLARDPSLSQDCAYEFLRAGAEDLVGLTAEDTPGWDPFMGHGRLNAGAALQAQTSCDTPNLLTGSPGVISHEDGGSQALVLDADASYAGATYVVLGSLTGTSPSIFVGGFPIPLVLDAYFLHSLIHPNSVVVPSVGLLDDFGEATATFTLSPGSSPALAGIEINHAYVVLGPTLDTIVAVSNAYPVDIVQDMLVLVEDFENGGTGWTFDNSSGGLWHVAAAGECGAPSAAAAYDHGPATCEYSTSDAGTSGALVSPEVLLGFPPFELRFESTLGLAPGDLVLATVNVQEAGGGSTVLATVFDLDTSGTTEHVTLPLSPTLSGKRVHLSFELAFLLGLGGGSGWRIDDVELESGG